LLNEYFPYFDKFRLAKYTIDLEAGYEGLELPPYKGSTFRGGFGYAFKSMVCTRKSTECNNCILIEQCPYSYIFETAPSSEAKVLKNFLEVPRPYVIEPPLERKVFYKAGERLQCNLILIGKAVDMLPYFIVTFEELGRCGIGRGRKQFNLRKVIAHNLDGPTGCVYSAEDRKVKNINATITGRDLLDKAWQIKNSVNEITLYFITPTRIKNSQRLCDKFEFYILMGSLLRRFSNLLYFHHGTQVRINYEAFIESCKGVSIIEDRTKWMEWERFSHRQQSRMNMGGLMGKITYCGQLDNYLPLLFLGEYIHVGKNVTFGLGKFMIKK
jgi:hypothetical protein